MTTPSRVRVAVCWVAVMGGILTAGVIATMYSMKSDMLERNSACAWLNSQRHWVCEADNLPGHNNCEQLGEMCYAVHADRGDSAVADCVRVGSSKSVGGSTSVIAVATTYGELYSSCCEQDGEGCDVQGLGVNAACEWKGDAGARTYPQPVTECWGDASCTGTTQDECKQNEHCTTYGYQQPNSNFISSECGANQGQ